MSQWSSQVELHMFWNGSIGQTLGYIYNFHALGAIWNLRTALTLTTGFAVNVEKAIEKFETHVFQFARRDVFMVIAWHQISAIVILGLWAQIGK